MNLVCQEILFLVPIICIETLDKKTKQGSFSF